jgi:hypothetical protein
MPDFAALFDSLGPDGTPDFDKFARASGMDAGEMKGHAARLWKHMDHLAKSPDEYQQFIRKQAENAGVDPTAFSAAGVGAGSGGKGGVGAAAAGTARGGGGRAPISDNRATFLMPMGQGGGTTEVGVVAVWRANDASTPTATAPDLLALFPLPNSPHAGPVKFRRRAAPRVEMVALPDPRQPEDDADMLSSLAPTAGIPSLTAGSVGKNQPGLAPQIEATIYDLEVHPEPSNLSPTLNTES